VVSFIFLAVNCKSQVFINRYKGLSVKVSVQL